MLKANLRIQKELILQIYSDRKVELSILLYKAMEDEITNLTEQLNILQSRLLNSSNPKSSPLLGKLVKVIDKHETEIFELQNKNEELNNKLNYNLKNNDVTVVDPNYLLLKLNDEVYTYQQLAASFNDQRREMANKLKNSEKYVNVNV